MAHFAKLGADSRVVAVIVVDNGDIEAGGIESEAVGVSFLRDLTGHQAWVQTSYNGKLRKRFAGIGYFYDSERDEFVPPGWTLDPVEGWADPNPVEEGLEEEGES